MNNPAAIIYYPNFPEVDFEPNGSRKNLREVFDTIG
jgi:hypothetical protein